MEELLAAAVVSDDEDVGRRVPKDYGEEKGRDSRMGRKRKTATGDGIKKRDGKRLNGVDKHGLHTLSGNGYCGWHCRIMWKGGRGWVVEEK